MMRLDTDRRRGGRRGFSKPPTWLKVDLRTISRTSCRVLRNLRRWVFFLRPLGELEIPVKTAPGFGYCTATAVQFKPSLQKSWKFPENIPQRLNHRYVVPRFFARNKVLTTRNSPQKHLDD